MVIEFVVKMIQGESVWCGVLQELGCGVWRKSSVTSSLKIERQDPVKDLQSHRNYL